MPLPVITNVVRYAAEFTAPSGKNAANVWHFKFTGAGAPAISDLNALSANWSKFYKGPDLGGGGHILGQCHSAWKYNQDVLTPLDGISPSQIYTIAAAGALGGSSMPSEIAEVLTLRTLKRGRRYRGRVYLPSVTTLGQDTSGNIVGTIQTAFVAQWAGALAVIAPLNWLPVVASYKFASAEDIDHVTMDNKFDIQRRRK